MSRILVKPFIHIFFFRYLNIYLFFYPKGFFLINYLSYLHSEFFYKFYKPHKKHNNKFVNNLAFFKKKMSKTFQINYIFNYYYGLYNKSVLMFVNKKLKKYNNNNLNKRNSISQNIINFDKSLKTYHEKFFIFTNRWSNFFKLLNQNKFKNRSKWFKLKRYYKKKIKTEFKLSYLLIKRKYYKTSRKLKNIVALSNVKNNVLLYSYWSWKFKKIYNNLNLFYFNNLNTYNVFYFIKKKIKFNCSFVNKKFKFNSKHIKQLLKKNIYNVAVYKFIKNTSLLNLSILMKSLKTFILKKKFINYKNTKKITLTWLKLYTLLKDKLQKNWYLNASQSKYKTAQWFSNYDIGTKNRLNEYSFNYDTLRINKKNLTIFNNIKNYNLKPRLYFKKSFFLLSQPKYFLFNNVKIYKNNLIKYSSTLFKQNKKCNNFSLNLIIKNNLTNKFNLTKQLFYKFKQFDLKPQYKKITKKKIYQFKYKNDYIKKLYKTIVKTNKLVKKIPKFDKLDLKSPVNFVRFKNLYKLNKYSVFKKKKKIGNRWHKFKLIKLNKMWLKKSNIIFTRAVDCGIINSFEFGLKTSYKFVKKTVTDLQKSLKNDRISKNKIQGLFTWIKILNNLKKKEKKKNLYNFLKLLNIKLNYFTYFKYIIKRNIFYFKNNTLKLKLNRIKKNIVIRRGIINKYTKLHLNPFRYTVGKFNKLKYLNKKIFITFKRKQNVVENNKPVHKMQTNKLYFNAFTFNKYKHNILQKYKIFFKNITYKNWFFQTFVNNLNSLHLNIQKIKSKSFKHTFKLNFLKLYDYKTFKMYNQICKLNSNGFGRFVKLKKKLFKFWRTFFIPKLWYFIFITSFTSLIKKYDIWNLRQQLTVYRGMSYKYRYPNVYLRGAFFYNNDSWFKKLLTSDSKFYQINATKNIKSFLPFSKNKVINDHIMEVTREFKQILKIKQYRSLRRYLFDHQYWRTLKQERAKINIYFCLFYRYHHKLTKYLFRFKLLSIINIFRHFCCLLVNIFVKSHLASSYNEFKFLLANSCLFLNGLLVMNKNIPVYSGDIMALSLNWFLFKYLKFVKLKLKNQRTKRFKYYYNYIVKKPLPDLILYKYQKKNILYKFQDIPYFLETDLMTLTSVMILNPSIHYMFANNYWTFNQISWFSLFQLNWKYIN